LPDQNKISFLAKEAILLLKELIDIPSFSKEEDRTAIRIREFLETKGIPVSMKLNNVWAFNKYYDAVKPTILLNSHHDTVRPNAGYSLDPFEAIEKDGKLYGLGSNDAGASLVSLLACFLYFYEKKSGYNFVFVASAEEENSGLNGIEAVLPELGKIDFAIVGEPTNMNLAIAEKGLMVLDCKAKGKSGHAAREDGENSIYKAMQDIEWIKAYQFPKVSENLGAVKMTVTIINAGSQHNVIPAECSFTVDVRITDAYTNEEVLEIIRSNIQVEANPRSMRMRPSSIDKDHPIVIAGKNSGRSTYGSPTTSDQALMNFPSLKLGPGDSARSHTADEFIYIDEIKEGIEIYIKMLEQITTT
jgi:acetylornithine deacetylase